MRWSRVREAMAARSQQSPAGQEQKCSLRLSIMWSSQQCKHPSPTGHRIMSRNINSSLGKISTIPPAHSSYPGLLGKYPSLSLPRRWTLGQSTAPIKSTNREKISSITETFYTGETWETSLPSLISKNPFRIFQTRTDGNVSVVDFYLWPFPDNPSGLGRVRAQFLISQWSAPSWKAVVLKQTPTPQTLSAQSLVILARELERLLVGAAALLPLLLVSQPICPGRHPQPKSVKIRPQWKLCFVWLTREPTQHKPEVPLCQPHLCRGDRWGSPAD